MLVSSDHLRWAPRLGSPRILTTLLIVLFLACPSYCVRHVNGETTSFHPVFSLLLHLLLVFLEPLGLIFLENLDSPDITAEPGSVGA